MKAQLPGGRIVELRRVDGEARTDLLYAEARRVLGDVDAFTLAEFHAARAIATQLGWIEEDEIEIVCRNCEEKFSAHPCAAMPLGPFIDAELDDEELDEVLDVSVAHEVTGLGAVRLASRTMKEAEPLHRALAKPELEVTREMIVAMGVVAIDDERDPTAISRMIRECDDRAFGELGNLFLAAHYPPRLFGLAMCSACGTRNDVDAPYDREFEPYEELPETHETFPSFDEFDALTGDIAEHLLANASAPTPRLIACADVPAIDDGGEPLLGSFLPGEITIYYRSFAAMWREDGPYDVHAEIEETIAHELEHQEADLVGHDPKDDEERDEIAREARRVIGRKAIARDAAGALVLDVGGFLKRTWILWVVALIAVIIATTFSK